MYIQSAVRASMPSYSESFRHVCPALAACNGSLVRRNFRNLTTSFFRFVCEISEESSPRSIIDVLGKVGMPDHAFDIQIFNSDVTVSLNKEIGEFMQEVRPLICNEFVQFGNWKPRLSPVCRAFDFPAQSSLQDFQSPFRSNEITGILNLYIIGQSSKAFKPDINADFVVGEFMFLSPNRNFTTENSEPFTSRGSLDSEGLDFALNRSMQNNLNVTNFGKSKLVTTYESMSILRVSNAFVPPEGLESGKSDFTFSFFYSPEEVLVSFVNPVRNILKNLTVNIFEFRIFSLKFDNMVVHVKLVKGLLAILVGFDSGFEKFVVEEAHNRKILFKNSNLFRSRIQTVFVHPLCRKHIDTYVTKRI